MAQVQIDLGSLTGDGRVRNLSGHDKGAAARERFSLDVLDASDAPIRVIIPDFVYAVSSSFVQGMFMSSLRHLGSLDKFFKHYEFDASSAVIRQIERGLASKRFEAA